MSEYIYWAKQRRLIVNTLIFHTSLQERKCRAHILFFSHEKNRSHFDVQTRKTRMKNEACFTKFRSMRSVPLPLIEWLCYQNKLIAVSSERQIYLQFTSDKFTKSSAHEALLWNRHGVVCCLEPENAFFFWWGSSVYGGPQVEIEIKPFY